MSENKKPRIAEILGVEVGERFSLMGFQPHYVEFWIKSDGTFETEPPRVPNSTVALLRAIEQPCFVIRKPRWTEQDKEDAKAIKRIYNGFWIGVKRESPTKLHTVGIDGYPSRQFINPKMFPSLKPGEGATLDEIIGDEE